VTHVSHWIWCGGQVMKSVSYQVVNNLKSLMMKMIMIGCCWVYLHCKYMEGVGWKNDTEQSCDGRGLHGGSLLLRMVYDVCTRSSMHSNFAYSTWGFWLGEDGWGWLRCCRGQLWWQRVRCSWDRLATGLSKDCHGHGEKGGIDM